MIIVFKRFTVSSGMILVLILIMISGSTLAADEIHFKELMEIAVTRNSDLEMARLRLENAKISYQKNELINLMANSRLMKLEGELKLVEAEENYKNIKNEMS